MHQDGKGNNGFSVFMLLIFSVVSVLLGFYGKLSVNIVILYTAMLAALLSAVPLAAAAASIFAATAAGALVFSNWGFYALLLMICLPAPAAAAIMTIRGRGFKKTVIAASVAAGISFLAVFCLYLSRIGPISFEGFGNYIRQAVNNICGEAAALWDKGQQQLPESERISPKDVQELLSYMIMRNLAGFFCMFCTLFGTAAAVLGRAAFRLRSSLKAERDFSVSAAGGVLFAAAFLLRFLPGAAGAVFDNFIIVMLPALIYEGILFISFLVSKHFLGGTSMYIFIAAMIVLQPVPMLLTVAGVGAVDAVARPYINKLLEK